MFKDDESIFEMKARLDALWGLAGVSGLTDRQYEKVEELEIAILRAPASTRKDIRAKAELLRANLLGGPRSDEADLAALDTIIDWTKRPVRQAA